MAPGATLLFCWDGGVCDLSVLTGCEVGIGRVEYDQVVLGLVLVDLERLLYVGELVAGI